MRGCRAGGFCNELSSRGFVPILANLGSVAVDQEKMANRPVHRVHRLHAHRRGGCDSGAGQRRRCVSASALRRYYALRCGVRPGWGLYLISDPSRRTLPASYLLRRAWPASELECGILRRPDGCQCAFVRVGFYPARSLQQVPLVSPRLSRNFFLKIKG